MAIRQRDNRLKGRQSPAAEADESTRSLRVPEPDERTRLIAARLDAIYGRKRWRSHGPVLDEIVATILSQNTSDANSSKAFASLKQRFPTWDALLAASDEQIADSILSGGLATIKAPRIRSAVWNMLRRYPEQDFTSLAGMPVDDARSELTALEGIGPKTASCVLLFSLGMPAMPVDTHVHRVAMRTGMIEPGTTPERAHAILESRLDGTVDSAYSFHLNVIQHGRSVCIARRPRCEQCSLTDVCSYYLEMRFRTT
jgi:endonuclease III